MTTLNQDASEGGLKETAFLFYETAGRDVHLSGNRLTLRKILTDQAITIAILLASRRAFARLLWRRRVAGMATAKSSSRVIDRLC